MSIKIMLSNSEYKVYTSKELRIIPPIGIHADFCSIQLNDGDKLYPFKNLELAKKWLLVPDLHMAFPPHTAKNVSGKLWEVYTTHSEDIHKYLYALNTPVNGIVAWGGYNPEDVNF